MSFVVSSPLGLEAVGYPPNPAPPGRMLQLDGIRGLAVLGVLAWHWMQYPYLRYFPLGIIAVRVFFVLSGFLITGILLRARQQHEQLGGPWWGPVRHFYIRRVLRIFPLYYAVLALILIGGVSSAREYSGWHLLYLSNFLSAHLREYGGSTGHFWSLAVEEQFYLVWPWLVLFMPRRMIPWAIGTMLALGPIYRFIAFAMTNSFGAATVLPVACLDSLGAGALLAWGRERSGLHPAVRNRLINLCFWIGAPILALGIGFYNHDNLGIGWVIVTDLGVALTTAWLIARASRGIRGPVGWCLEFPPLVYMGTVSYCVYLVHPFIHTSLPHVFAKLHLTLPRTAVQLLIEFALTLAIATASWFLFERRLVRLGRSLTPEPAAASSGRR